MSHKIYMYSKFKCNVKHTDTFLCQSYYDECNTRFTKILNFFVNEMAYYYQNLVVFF